MKEKKYEPPRFARWILNRIADFDIIPYIAGDFEEVYSNIAKDKNRWRTTF